MRRFLPELIDGAVAANPCLAVLTPVLGCLRGLLGDGAAATARRALQSAYPAFRASYALVALRGGAPGLAAEEAEALRTLWAAATALKLMAAKLVGGGEAEQPASEPVRQAAARFLEQAVMLLTAEVVPAVAGVSDTPQPVPAANAVAGKAAVVRDAEAALSQLVALLRRRLGEQVPPALAVTAVRSAAGIAQQRPQFVGRLLPPLLALAASDSLQGGAAAGGPAGAAAAASRRRAGQAEGVADVAAALKQGLLAVSRSSAPAVQPWKRKIAAALQALGAGEEGRPAADGRWVAVAQKGMYEDNSAGLWPFGTDCSCLLHHRLFDRAWSLHPPACPTSAQPQSSLHIPLLPLAHGALQAREAAACWCRRPKQAAALEQRAAGTAAACAAGAAVAATRSTAASSCPPPSAPWPRAAGAAGSAAAAAAATAHAT